MSFLLKTLTLIGLVLLTHSVYSAYEHTHILFATTAIHSQSSPLHASPFVGTNAVHSNKRPSLPTDIVVELLLSTLILTLAITLSAPALRPIKWAEWAGNIERSGGKALDGSGTVEMINPYRLLEERRGFWDVRAARKDFADFIRRGDLGVPK